jgi:glycosyltransferase involved in cell wall biosynthesis
VLTSAAPERVCIVDYAGHPFQVQLSRKLAERGNTILHLFFGQAITPHGPLSVTAADPKSLEIEAISLGTEYHKYSYVRRWWQEQVLASSFAGRVARFRPDVVIVANAPLDIARAIQRAVRTKSPFILWQQDIYSVALGTILKRELGLLGATVATYYHFLETKILRRSDAVIVISPNFAELDTSKFGLKSDSLTVIPNWAPVDDIRPGPRNNAWARARGLIGRKVVMYSGTLGSKHDPMILRQIAEHLSKRDDATLVVVSEGANVSALQKEAEARGLRSIEFYPFQPYEDFPSVLATSSVLIAILDDEAGVFSVPSKVLSYLCAGRPILLCAPPENFASRVVLEAEAGFVYRASASDELLRGLDHVLDDEVTAAQLGENGRRYAVRTFDIEKIADRFVALFQSVLQR